MTTKHYLLISIGVVIIGGIFLALTGKLKIPSITQSTQTNQIKPNEVVNDVPLAWEEEGAKVPLDQILNGCPSQDCIPSIDEPVYESLSEGDSWLEPTDRVFVFERNDITRIYPQRILNWHEIVNDWYGDDPIAVTFCPLCGSAVAFERVVDDTVTEFGVSGKLHNSDLIMYDRLEGSLWQQITGEAVVGPAARRDEVLTPLFLVILAWDEAKAKYPEAEVLSRDTGFTRSYDVYPYGSYEAIDNTQVGFGAPTDDARLAPKAWVYGISVNDQPFAFLESDIESAGSITTQIAGSNVQVDYNNGAVTFTNLDSSEDIIPTRLFWFAWAAFNPNTGLYSK